MQRILFVTTAIATLLVPPNERLAIAHFGSLLAAGTRMPPPATRVIMQFKNQRGQDCDIVRQTVTIAGRPAEATGTMCRRFDGYWRFTR